MNKITFIIENHGDPSVGIWGFTAKVSLDDPFGYDAEDILEMKKMFADHYDVPVDNVLTEEEYKIHLEEMLKMSHICKYKVSQKLREMGGSDES